MRVIAGTARRTHLIAPKGITTRPTSDMAKEALFNILGDAVRGAWFLDLFCGSGAIGIEALSRGADHAAFVDNTTAAIDALRQNLKKTNLDARILHADIAKALQTLTYEKKTFDIIFLDPPYETQYINDCLASDLLDTLLSSGGMIIAETDRAMEKQNMILPGRFKHTDTRYYGKATFMFFERHE